eukprot:NODE_791_length_3859_cov_0.266755.p1 type:complete len:220 gc:universal NODE_791_length_3859_cov_0.266755:762-103(-)
MSIGRPVENFIRILRGIKGLPPKPNIHKNSKITGPIGVFIKQQLLANPRLSYRRLSGYIFDEFKISICHSWLKKYADDNGIITVKAYKRPVLSARNKLKRLKFARKYLNEIEYLRNILWSDETSVTTFPTRRQIQIKVHSSVKKLYRPTIPLKQQGGFSVMFWGCFSFYEFGPLRVVEGRINQNSYLDIIKDTVEPELQASEHHWCLCRIMRGLTRQKK